MEENAAPQVTAPGSLSQSAAATPVSPSSGGQQPALSVEDLRLQELRLTLSLQISTFTALGTRVTTILSVLVGTIAAAVAIERAVAPSVPIWAFIVIVVVVAIVTIATILVPSTLLTSTTVDIGEDPEELQKRALLSPAAFREWLIQEYSDMIRGNRPAIEDRADVVEKAMILLLVAAIALILTSTVLYGTVVLGR